MESRNDPNRSRNPAWEECEARYEAAFNLISSMQADKIVDFYLREATAEASTLWESLCEAFRKLAEVDPAKTRAIYVGLAQREDPKERWFGAFHIIHLTPLDHAIGMDFWEKFMCDPEPQVRKLAFDTLE